MLCGSRIYWGHFNSCKSYLPAFVPEGVVGENTASKAITCCIGRPRGAAWVGAATDAAGNRNSQIASTCYT